jgi:hypothetical protein
MSFHFLSSRKDNLLELGKYCKVIENNLFFFYNVTKYLQGCLQEYRYTAIVPRLLDLSI